MVRNSRLGARRRRRGAAMVEMALILPIFLLLTVGLIEFGRAFMVQQMVTNASRDGARLGSLPGIGNSEVEASVRQSLTVGRIDSNVVRVTVTPTNLQEAQTGAQVRVGIQVAFQDVSWMPAPWFLGQANLSSETVMRRE